MTEREKARKRTEDFVRDVLERDLNRKKVSKTTVREVAKKVSRAVG